MKLSKIRINELARELEVKPNIILDMLPELGVEEKKTHSSSIDEDVAIAIKHRLGHSDVDSEHRRAGEGSQTAVALEEPPDEHEAEPPPEKERRERFPDREPAATAQDNGASAGQAEPVDNAPAASTTEELHGGGKRSSMPLRPPLALGGARPAQPSHPAPEKPSAPSRPQTASPGSPAPSAPPKVISGRDVPLYRPGQVISGPRQPLPPGTPSTPEAPRPDARTSPLVPGAPRPAPTPGAPTPRPPQLRQQPPQQLTVPRPPVQPSQGPGPGPNRPALVGQPQARPVVPPRPDLLRRIQETRPAPGAPAAPRPGMPQQRPASPMPGRPIYQGPGRPGQPGARGPMGPGGPGGPAGLRGRRPMHPTSPVRVEPAAPPPTETQRRMQGKPRPSLDLEQRKREAEGRLRGPDPRSKAQPLPVVDKEITIGEGITVKELAEKLGVKSSLVVKILFDRKIFATINQTLDLKLAQDLARAFGARTTTLSFEEEATWSVELAEDPKDLQSRPPVVTVMGHVDHGKTSLLDAIRSTEIAAREAGGITQHIGASVVEQNGKKVVFIDTPGHEAFTRMRARGAKVTDIVILVVAADDGVMPQTIEAIDHAKAAKVPIIVAINKVDKPDAQPERIKQQLADRGLLAEDWGGDVVMVPVSAKTHQNIDVLLEMVLLVTEMANLRANSNRPAVGTVLEAELDRGRGPVATVIVQNGTLKIGDFFICGQVFGKVRAMYDHFGSQIREAGPAMPVEVLGLDALPEVGDAFQVVTDTAKAKQIVLYREIKNREQSMAKGARVTLEQFHQQAAEAGIKDLNVIIKTDVGGTAEVLSEMLQKLSTDKVRIRVIAKNVGAINESDVLLASASNAIIIGFNVRPERNAASLADKEKIDIRLHTIIYELTDEIKKAMTGMLDPVFKEVFRGRCDVREVFKISKVGTVAGCYVTEGTLTRDSQVRILRDNVVIHTGRIESLRRFKQDVSEVKSGFECGVTIANFGDVKQGDIFEAYGMERIAPQLT
jgi:translation initiation factor IF-2